MIRMDIEGVIFDLDGTLVDTIEDIAGSVNEMFSRNGLPVHEVSRYLEWVGSGATRLVQQAHGGILEEVNLRKYVTEFKEIYSKNLHHRSRVYDGVTGVLDVLAGEGVRLAILSNKPHLLTRKVVSHYLSRWPFHPVLGQRDDVPRKPDPAGALEISALLGLDPARILFAGDSQNDMLTARAAGMIPLGVSWGYGGLGTGEEKQDYTVINRPSELLSFIKNQSHS